MQKIEWKKVTAATNLRRRPLMQDNIYGPQFLTYFQAV